MDLAHGVPVVREAAHNLPDPASITTSYLFRDPQDFLESVPATAYNIIHGGASHRILFTSPEIPSVQASQQGIQAAQVWVADALALGKSSSIFPHQSDCLPITIPGVSPDAKQTLEILAGGVGYKFEPKRLLDGVESPNLDVPDLERTFKQNASVQTVAQTIKEGTDLFDGGKTLTKDVLAAKTTISVAINTLQNVSKMDVTNLHMVIKTVTGTVNDASRVRQTPPPV